jgi:pimeloyl-ACP methyl ester carboxylesterase
VATGTEHILDGWQSRGTHHNVLGHRMFVVDVPAQDASSGKPPVLVLHGFPTSGIDWRLVLDRLSADRRVVIPDLLGYGFSAKPDQAYSLFEQADLVDALARQLGLTEVALVTHDMGDSVGGEVLARSIDGSLSFGIERRVVTNGSIYIEMAHLTDGQKLLSSLPDERLPDGVGAGGDGLRVALSATFAPDHTVAADEVGAMADAIVHDDGHRLLPRLIRYLDERRVHQDRWTGAIERHPAPLHVVWGDLDPIAVWPMVERLHTARPDARVHRLEGIGHYPMVEAPDRFAAAIVAGLA